jgi:hypothetical protein
MLRKHLVEMLLRPQKMQRYFYLGGQNGLLKILLVILAIMRVEWIFFLFKILLIGFINIYLSLLGHFQNAPEEKVE